MKRKSFTFDDLKFFERDKGFSDLEGVTERYKAEKFAFIQKHTDDPDDRVSLLGIEMHKDYTANELGLFLSTNKQEIRLGLFHSYCKNPELNGKGFSFEEFSKLIVGKEDDITKLLTELENPLKKTKQVVVKH